MISLDSNYKVRPTQTAHTYLKHLKEKEKVFDRMIDAYLFAAAYALKEELEIESLTGSSRQDLVDLSIVDKDVLMSLSAGIYIVCQHKGQSQPKDSKDVGELLTQYAEAGLMYLQKLWKNKIKDQIYLDVIKFMKS